MSSYKKFFSSVAFAAFISLNTNAQVSLSTTDTMLTTPFYKWELGIDLLPLADKAKDAVGFIIKRNYQTESGRSAIRFKLLPQLFNNPGTNATGKESNSSINIAVGYEWQKLYSRFSILYGVEPFFQYSLQKIAGLPNGTVVFKQSDTKVGVSGFVGGRYFVGRHIALTVESHLIYQHRITKGDYSTVASSFATYDQIFVDPIHAFYLSYHF